MGEVWIPEAEDLRAEGSSGTMSGVGPPRAIAHVTVSPSGGPWFDSMHKVLIGKKAEPHLLYDPVNDRLGQYFPLNRSARALMNGGKDISHNKVGKVCIQVEFVAQPDGFTRYWSPGPNYRAMMRAIRSWGVEDEFVARPARSYGDNVRQSWSKYKTVGGWWHHAHVPSPETHWDAGPIDHAAFFKAAPQEDDMPLTATDISKIGTDVWTRPVYLNGKRQPIGVAIQTAMQAAVNGAKDAAIARSLAEASAKNPAPLTQAQIDEIAKTTVAAFDLEYEANVTLTPKESV